ncbi:malate dehydrogenase [Ceratobasidium sp. AG-Ba]|nr:malate dehydrogenase [Ceratobasidium sp. AG-Ba]
MDVLLQKFNKLFDSEKHPDLWHIIHPEKANTTFHIALKGEALLSSSKWNKGLAFTHEERKEFELEGRLPHTVASLDHQCQRAYLQFSSRETPILKNSFLQSLKQQNWVLYYSLLGRHLKEMIPIIYTPTEAEAIANYSHLFRKSEGLFLTYTEEEDMEKSYLAQTRHRDVDLVVVSDAEAILGIGDQGVGGIGISTAKATIYSLIGGIDPSKALSVTLDVGTDNKDLLEDELYVGWRHKRVRGKDYDRFVDKFVQLVRKHNPHSLLHFEDFGVTNAQRLLELYRDKHAVFNDDVQGTGAVTLACLMAAVGVTKSKLSDQRIIIFGAGTAGLGITRQIRDAMVTIDKIPRDEANKKFFLIDKEGLVKKSVKGGVRHGLEEFVRSDDEWSGVGTLSNVGLLDVVKKVQPTVLIGCSTKGGAFTEEVVREMGKHVDRPIIFPLSNPSRLVEVDPKDANDWTEGRALLATGSPFPPAKMPNGKEYIIAECNNALIYPGLGLGAIISQSRTMSDTMLLAGTQALASLAPALKDPDQALLPDFQDAKRANFEVAVAVAEQAIEEGSAGVKWSKEQVRAKVKEKQWEAIYGTYKYDPKGEI